MEGSIPRRNRDAIVERKTPRRSERDAAGFRGAPWSLLDQECGIRIAVESLKGVNPMITLRWLLLLAFAAVLPSCGREREEWLWVTVHNDGTESAGVWSEAKYVQAMGVWQEHTEVSVDPTMTVKFGFRFEAMTELTVVVHRSSDSAVIFLETWNRNELEHMHGFLEMTVSP
jgi:hypothetical protein